MAAKKQESGQKTLSLEQAMKELEQVTEKLGGQELTLEESFALYKKGMDLLLTCNRAIDKVEKELTVLEENGIGGEF